MSICLGKSGNMSQIHIFPEMIDDIKQEASSILNPSWVEMEFAKLNCIDDILEAPSVQKNFDDPEIHLLRIHRIYYEQF